LQAFCGKQGQSWAIKLVQKLCNVLACAKTVQIECRPEICANSVQTFGGGITQLCEFESGAKRLVHAMDKTTSPSRPVPNKLIARQ
jgi:hypothetical protein